MAILTGKLGADFDSFNNAVEGTLVKLRGFETGAAKVSAAMTSMGNSFSGQKIIADATMAVKVVNDMGGASKLTASEMARVNATVTEALAKYKALGGTAPQAMHDLADATKKIDPPITTFIGRLNQAKDGLAAFASGAKTIGMGLTASVTAPLAAVGIAAFKASTDFESAFAGVKKTVSGTPDELAKINSEFREMAKTTPVSAVGLAHIGEMAGQLGVQKSAITGFTKTIVDISVATNLTADEAGSAFARLANVMKLPQDQFSNLGSAVVALGNFGASTEQEMLSMAQRISAAGATAGMTVPQVLGISNALSSVGIEAEAGGTAVSKVIIQIATSVASGGKQLDLFSKVAGVSSKEFQKAWRDDAGTAFSTFMQGLAKVRESGGDQLIGVMEDLGFTEVRLRNAMMSAANAGSLMADSIALGSKAFAENTELARASEERYKTVNNQMKVLWNQVTDVAITIGDALIPTLLDLVKAGQPMIAWLSDAAKWFKELPEWVRSTAVGMLALGAAVGPAAYIIGSLASAVANLIPMMTALSGASALSGMGAVVGFLGNPLVLAGAVVIGGIALAVYELNKNLSALSHIPSVGKPLEGLKDAGGHLIVTADAAKKAASEVGALSTGFKLTIASIKPATAALDAHTGAVTLSRKEIAAQKKELDEVAKAHEMVRQASVPLTAAQQSQLKSLMDLNTAAGETIISTKTMAKEIGSSETQVKVFEGGIKLAALALDVFIEGMQRSREAAEKLEPKLGGLGFKMLHEDIARLKEPLKEFYDGLGKTETTLSALVTGSLTKMPDAVAGGTKAIKDATEAADDGTKATNDWGGALSTLSNDFVQMAQIGGDSFGDVARVIGTVIKSFQMVTTAVDTFQKASQSAAGATSADYTAMAASAFSAGIAIGQMIVAYQEAKYAAETLRIETHHLDTQQKFWNTDIKFTHELYEAMKTPAGALVKEIEELGGVAALSADQMKILGDRLQTALFNRNGAAQTKKSMAELNALLAEMGQVAIDAGKLVDQTFLDLIKHAKDLGVEVAGVNELLLTQLGGAAEGLNEILLGLQKSSTNAAKQAAQSGIDELEAQIADSSGRVKADLEEQLKAAKKAQDELVGSFSVTAEQGAGLAAAIAGDFAEMVDRGMSFKDALDKLKPSIEILTKAMSESGVDGGAAFDFLTEMSRIAGDAIMGPLSDAITGANKALKGLHNSGILNQTMFTGLEQSAMQAYQKIIDGGGDGNAALMMLQPTLQTLWAMQKDFGYQVDAATQALLDEAEATGKVGDKHRPIAEQMLLATNKIAAAVEGLARVFGVVLPSAIDETAETLDATDWESWRDRGVDAAHDVEEAVDAVSFGHSPGGLKEIPILLAASSDALVQFARDFTSGMADAYGAVQSVNAPLDALKTRLDNESKLLGLTGIDKTLESLSQKETAEKDSVKTVAEYTAEYTRKLASLQGSYDRTIISNARSRASEIKALGIDATAAEIKAVDDKYASMESASAEHFRLEVQGIGQLVDAYESSYSEIMTLIDAKYDAESMAAQDSVRVVIEAEAKKVQAIMDAAKKAADIDASLESRASKLGIKSNAVLQKEARDAVQLYGDLAIAATQGLFSLESVATAWEKVVKAYELIGTHPMEAMNNFKPTAYAATGGYVTDRGIQHFAGGGAVLNFRPRGTDTVPAMLTPGEMVLTPAQQQQRLGGGGQSFAALETEVKGLRADMRAFQRDSLRAATVAATSAVLRKRRVA